MLPPCRFFGTTAGCLRMETCIYSHAKQPANPTSVQQCIYFARGVCRNGDKCRFLHGEPVQPVIDIQKEARICGICLEESALYGLLLNCSHSFCMDCIVKWRNPSARESLDQIKSCPECRSPSAFIVPSRTFPESADEKSVIVQAYRDSCHKKPCRIFESSRRQTCLYGDECLYAHIDASGNTVTGLLKTIGTSTRRSRPDVYDMDSLVEALLDHGLSPMDIRDLANDLGLDLHDDQGYRDAVDEYFWGSDEDAYSDDDENYSDDYECEDDCECNDNHDECDCCGVRYEEYCCCDE